MVRHAVGAASANCPWSWNAPGPPQACYLTLCCLQHGARLALIELEPRDSAEWRRRVEARGAADAGTDNCHKPGSWADIQAIAARNAGSEAWSEALGEGEPPLRLQLDSTAPGSDTAAQLAAVLSMLQRCGMAFNSN